MAVDNRPRYQQCLGENFVQDLGWTMDPEDVKMDPEDVFSY